MREFDMADDSQALATEKEARDVAESARETEWAHPSFVRELFLGRFALDLIHPHPPEDAAEAAPAKPFMDKLRAFMERVDSEEIDRTGEIPEPLVQELRDMGAFGIKIPTEYGGLGLSQMSYIRAMEMVTSKDGSLTALLSASQSIGVPQPLKLFGTPEQKKRFFPRLAKGAISAFALTETDAGSDPANLRDTDRGRLALHHQRREAVVHQRHARRPVRGHGAHAGRRRERQAEEADYRLHRGREDARGCGETPPALHGAQGDREWRH